MAKEQFNLDTLELYTQVANEFISEMKKNKGVIGAMHLGGIARGFADEYSDIDIAIFSQSPLNIELGEREVQPGCIVEVFNIVVTDGSANWDDVQKEAYAEGIIAYDPTGKVATFLEEALFYHPNNRIKKMLDEIFHLAWHGFVFTPFRNKVVHGYQWVLPANLWFLREKPTNAFYLINVVINHFIDLLFSVNAQFVPDYKWKYLKAQKLDWLPRNYLKNIDYLLFTETTMETWPIKCQFLQTMVDEVVMKIKDELPDDWYAVINK